MASFLQAQQHEETVLTGGSTDLTGEAFKSGVQESEMLPLAPLVKKGDTYLSEVRTDVRV